SKVMSCLMPGLRHLGNPLPKQRRAFLVNGRAADLGHCDPRLETFEAVDEETLIGIAGPNSKFHPAAAASRRGRTLADTIVDADGIAPAQEEPAVRCASFGIVAMGAVDVEIGAGALCDRAGGGIVPARH